MGHEESSNAQMIDQFKTMTDQEVLESIAAVKICSMTPNQIDRVVSKSGRLLIKHVPKLEKVMGMGSDKLLVILMRCPYSD